MIFIIHTCIHINAYDIETFNLNNRFIPYCVVLILNEKYKFFYKNNPDENLIFKSIEFIFNNIVDPSKIIFYVHNLNFDGFILLEHLSHLTKFIVTSIIKENSIYAININFNEKNIEFRCSYKLLPLSLKKISVSFNLDNKLPFPYKFVAQKTLYYVGKLPELHFFNSEEDYVECFHLNYKIFNLKYYAIKYCKRDVFIVKKFVSILFELISTLKINIIKLNIFSISSLALHIFLKKFNCNKINVKYNREVDSLIRNSYYGGRCEVFGNIETNEKLFHFDFSGMYGQCMLEKFCFGKIKINFDTKDIDRPGFYYIKYKSENFNIPILPHHNKLNHKLMFTNGILEGVYWFEEIKYFLEKGGELIHIYYSVTYENYDVCFENFINYFNKLRNLGGAYKEFAKLVINSLYGRFGMQENTTHSLIVNELEVDWWFDNFNIISCSQLNKLFLIKVEVNRKLKNKLMSDLNTKNLSNISIASAVTSKARIKLLKAVTAVEKNEGILKYCDTDSIFAGFKKNVFGEKHGEVEWQEVEGEQIEDSFFALPKVYGLRYKNKKEIIKIKGISQIGISVEELKLTALSNAPTLNFNQNIFKKNLFLNEILINKEINFNTYDKRHWIDNTKKKTRPYIYDGSNNKYL